MKLIFCPHCRDIVLLRKQMRICECGMSGGHYLDHINAVVTGDAIPIGITNDSFIKAVLNRPKLGMGKEFVAFVIPEITHTVRNLEKEKDEKIQRDLEAIFGEDAAKGKKKRSTSHNHLIK